MPADIDIVVPVLNEAANIDEFYTRIDRLGLTDSLIFVDNGSTDGTLEWLTHRPHLRAIRHACNLGYGASLRDGIAAGTAAHVVIIDADLEYPPEQIPTLLDALERHPVVYASRFLAGRVRGMPRARHVGNIVLTRIFNALFAQRITDLYTGMKAVRRNAVDLSGLRMNGFTHAGEISVLIALSGVHIAEIPIRFVPRQRGRSKMRHVTEVLKLAALLLRYFVRGRLLGRPCFVADRPKTDRPTGGGDL